MADRFLETVEEPETLFRWRSEIIAVDRGDRLDRSEFDAELTVGGEHELTH